jgi:dTDP-4-dehydrorhamnose reductase
MKIIPVLIAGCHGELGSALVRRVSGKYNVIGLGRDEEKLISNVDYEYVKLDVLQRKDLKDVFKTYRPHFVINAIAMINVDNCEKEKEKCWKTNVESVQNIIYACKSIEANFIHISTDYIFNGKNGPYHEEDRPDPINYYGKSKLASENLVISSGLKYSIIRTSMLYSFNYVKKKQNFIIKMWEQLSNGNKMKVIMDEVRTPTLTENLADSIWKMINLERNGIFHIAGKDIIDRYAYALEFANYFGFDKNLIETVKAEDLENRVPRPKNCGLLVEKAEKELYLNLIGIKKGFELFKEQMKVS